jgi:hypothetical protein
MTVLIGKQEKRVVPDEPVADSVRRLEGAGMARMDAIKQVARERGLPKREVYKLFGNL